ncbi:MAG: radical SAM protein [Alphaproteobacteria bacterium]|nr:radical SAM protein [Alphaproteobacteria bacterium]
MLAKKIQSFFSNYFKFEPDYFTVGGWRKDLAYFIAQGNIWAHIVDRIKFRIFPKLMIVPAFPSHIDVEAASSCQMRCPMCYTTYMPDNLKGTMKWELYTKIIDEAARRHVYSIKLSWRGEPLLNKRIVDMVRYAKDKGIKEVAFLSNAELLNAKIAEQFVDAGLDWLSISADGVGEVYNEIRQPAVFEETIKRVRHMKEYRDSKGLSKPLLRVQSVMSAVENDPDAYHAAWEGIVDRINIISDHIRDFEDRDDLEYDPYYVCSKPWNRLNIAYDGRVHQCGADYSAKTIVGDCNTHSLYEIWHGVGNRKVRDAFRRHTYLDDLPACRQCSYGLVRELVEVNVGEAGVKAGRYKSVPKIVGEKGVNLHTPEDKLTSRQKKKREQGHASPSD